MDKFFFGVYMKIAIIGSGLSGCNLFNLLSMNNHEVTIFEKARGAGGRCSTRYVNDEFIDHGTSSFEATEKEFIYDQKQKLCICSDYFNTANL